MIFTDLCLCCYFCKFSTYLDAHSSQCFCNLQNVEVEYNSLCGNYINFLEDEINET